MADPYYEVEWLDEEGNGHQVTFADRDAEARDKFIQAIEPISAMIALYRVTKERL